MLATKLPFVITGAPWLRGACFCLSFAFLPGCAWLGGGSQAPTPAEASQVVCLPGSSECRPVEEVVPRSTRRCETRFETHQGHVIDPSEEQAEADFSVYFPHIRQRFEVPRTAEYVDLGHAVLANGTIVIAEIAMPQDRKACAPYITKLRVVG